MKRIRQKNINTREHFNEVFQEKPQLYDSYKNILFYNKALNLNLFSGKYLDYGCGNGDPLNKLKNIYNDLDIIGVDLSDEVINKNKIKYQNCTFITTDEFWDKPIEVNSIVSTHTFEHIENPKEILTNLLKLTDKLFIIVPYEDSWKECAQHIWRYDLNSFDFIKPDLALPGLINEAGNQEVIYYWNKNKVDYNKNKIKLTFFIRKLKYHKYIGVIKKIYKKTYENNSPVTS